MADEWGQDGKTGRIDPFVEIYDVRASLYPSLFIPR